MSPPRKERAFFLAMLAVGTDLSHSSRHTQESLTFAPDYR